ncbi:hypothetical protein BLOT_010071 [Blomia tropicalis]|nr:hypothetical protein BLOT_010071 [Blomia tropicalis]
MSRIEANNDDKVTVRRKSILEIDFVSDADSVDDDDETFDDMEPDDTIDPIGAGCRIVFGSNSIPLLLLLLPFPPEPEIILDGLLALLALLLFA